MASEVPDRVRCRMYGSRWCSGQERIGCARWTRRRGLTRVGKRFSLVAWAAVVRRRQKRTIGYVLRHSFFFFFFFGMEKKEIDKKRLV